MTGRAGGARSGGARSGASPSGRAAGGGGTRPGGPGRCAASTWRSRPGSGCCSSDRAARASPPCSPASPACSTPAAPARAARTRAPATRRGRCCWTASPPGRPGSKGCARVAPGPACSCRTPSRRPSWPAAGTTSRSGSRTTPSLPARSGRGSRRRCARSAFPYGLGHPTSALSGGERQRLALAGVLALRPGLLLLDEPSAMLDDDGARLLRQQVSAVLAATGATCVLVEHRLEGWLDLVDRVVVLGPTGGMDGGGVVADGTPERVFGEHGGSLAAAGVWVPGHAPQGGTVPAGTFRRAPFCGQRDGDRGGPAARERARRHAGRARPCRLAAGAHRRRSRRRRRRRLRLVGPQRLRQVDAGAGARRADRPGGRFAHGDAGARGRPA